MSKVMMIMFMYELQRRLNTDPSLSNISILGFDPGWVSTSIGRNANLIIRFIMYCFQFLAPPISLFWPNHFIRTAAKTGDDLVVACFDEKKFSEFPKALYVDGSEISARMNEEARDENKQKKLWEGSLKYAGIVVGDTVLVDWK